MTKVFSPFALNSVEWAVRMNRANMMRTGIFTLCRKNRWLYDVLIWFSGFFWIHPIPIAWYREQIPWKDGLQKSRIILVAVSSLSLLLDRKRNRHLSNILSRQTGSNILRLGPLLPYRNMRLFSRGKLRCSLGGTIMLWVNFNQSKLSRYYAID